MTLTFDTQTQLRLLTCCSCAGQYGLAERYAAERQKDGKTWHCPYCEAAVHYGDGENERLRKQVAQLTSRVDQKEAAIRDEQKRHEHTTNRLRGTKAALTRTKKAVAAGQCPCCSTEFKDLAAHMAEAHPTYQPDGEDVEEKN